MSDLRRNTYACFGVSCLDRSSGEYLLELCSSPTRICRSLHQSWLTVQYVVATNDSLDSISVYVGCPKRFLQTYDQSKRIYSVHGRRAPASGNLGRPRAGDVSMELQMMYYSADRVVGTRDIDRRRARIKVKFEDAQGCVDSSLYDLDQYTIRYYSPACSLNMYENSNSSASSKPGGKQSGKVIDGQLILIF